jgi:hypothetical protein
VKAVTLYGLVDLVRRSGGYLLLNTLRARDPSRMYVKASIPTEDGGTLVYVSREKYEDNPREGDLFGELTKVFSDNPELTELVVEPKAAGDVYEKKLQALVAAGKDVAVAELQKVLDDTKAEVPAGAAAAALEAVAKRGA